jgi:hypothetical protein
VHPQQTKPSYKALLLKYIEHVGRQTGLSHLEEQQRVFRAQETGFKDVSVFTDAEWQLMRKLSEDRTYRRTYLPATQS